MLNGVHDVDLEPPSLVEAPPAIVSGLGLG